MVETKALLMHTVVTFFTYQSAIFFGKLYIPLEWLMLKNGYLESLETILGMLIFNLGLFLSTIAYCCTRFLRNWSWLIFFSDLNDEIVGEQPC